MPRHLRIRQCFMLPTEHHFHYKDYPTNNYNTDASHDGILTLSPQFVSQWTSQQTIPSTWVLVILWSPRLHPSPPHSKIPATSPTHARPPPSISTLRFVIIRHLRLSWMKTESTLWTTWREIRRVRWTWGSSLSTNENCVLPDFVRASYIICYINLFIVAMNKLSIMMCVSYKV